MFNAPHFSDTQYERPIHGGRLHEAIKTYAIEKAHWLDLSTGINPRSWPIPQIPEEVWRCLPDDDNLLSIAARYYGSSLLQVTAGSQQSIELLPKILGDKLCVGIVAPTYAEHAYAWQKNGHQVLLLHPEEINAHLEQLDCLLIVNPNNPSGYCFHPDELCAYQDYFIRRSGQKSGYLIVDEAFMDSTSELSVIANVEKGHLIVLRSIGKFFGLAGLRCGFIFAVSDLLVKLSAEIMLWSVNHPARWIVSRALEDQQWIAQNKEFLQQQTQQLLSVLVDFWGHKVNISGCSLFQTVYADDVEEIYHLLACQGVLTRLLDCKKGLRFGLPGDSKALNKLTNAMQVAFN